MERANVHAVGRFRLRYDGAVDVAMVEEMECVVSHDARNRHGPLWMNLMHDRQEGRHHGAVAALLLRSDNGLLLSLADAMGEIVAEYLTKRLNER
ncbi:MAG: hypothetical protein ACRDIY_13670 [Chloroflexota bacterium]